MAMRFGDSDGQAIDLVLDRGAVVPNGAAAFYVPPGTDGLDKRVKNVEKIFRILAQLPTPEPSADLVARTMHRIDEAVAHAPQHRPDAPAQQGPGRHHA